MNIQPMTLEVNAPRMSQGQSTRKTSDKKNDDPFASVLSKTEDKLENQKNERIASDNTKSTSKPSPTEESTQVVKKEASKAISITEADSLEESITKESAEVEAAVIETVANLLQITPGELEQLLAVLQIGLADLLQGDNLQQLLMQVHNVEEPMDLLLIPEVASEMKAVTSILEEHAVNNLINVFSEELFQQELGVTVDENILGVNTSSGNNAQKNTKDDIGSKTQELEHGSSILEVAGTSTSKISAPTENDERLWQNEEGSTSNQNPSTSQFLETLTQSVGEAFQVKNEHIGQVKEATLGRYEVVNPRMVLDQIVEKIKISTLNEEAQMTIQLKPEHLGKLSMEVISKQGVMTAQFTVENEKTKAMLEQNIQNLKDTLEDKGLVIQHLEVTVGQNQQEDRQTYKNIKSNRDISNMISRMMNEDVLEEAQLEKPDKNETSEVDFIA